MKKRLLIITLLCAALTLPACHSSKSESPISNESTDKDTTVEETTPIPKIYDPSDAAQKYSEHQVIELWDTLEEVPYITNLQYASIPKIVPYIAEKNQNGGCVIICPGGGYVQLANDKEGTIPAEAFNEHNITAFVLRYRTNYSKEGVLTDIFRAIRYVRANADEFAIDPDKIAVMGFSAGGHLAAMSMEHYEEDTQNVDEIDKVSARPNLGILCYPVLSLKDEKTHELTREIFLGKDNVTDKELIQKYSAEEGVTEDTPPAFVWHTKADSAVPVENSIDFAEAMEEKGIDCELHLYELGSHGLGMATDYEEAGQWFPECIEWLRGYGY